ncbi:hypothetical protein ACEWY4_020904 [Coilia grayii]|uniref:C2 domain-containing protein n=1 Tax=Coilia grayii TaxID=363190 RepID=A0ABD1J8T2_9TELE
MYDKMSHRLLNQYKGWRWFGENGCLNTLPNPLKNYWQAKIDFPFPNTSADLTTEHIKPVVIGGGGANSETKPIAGHWQLDLNLIGLQFTLHPLFTKEHELASRLQRLCENYTSRGNTDKATFLQEKLRALKKSKMEMNAQGPRSMSRFRALTRQIRETERILSQTKEEDAVQLRNIISTWQCLKALRVKNCCVSTSVKLHFQKLELKARNGSPVHYDGSATDSTAESSRAEEECANGSTFMNDDIIFTPDYMGDWLQEALNAHTLQEKAGDGLHLTAQTKITHFPLVPILTMNETISSDFDCEKEEQCRRAALRDRSISVKIFYNGKLVSATSKSPFDLNFRVNIEETFNMQVTNWPESLMLEVHEYKKFRSTLLAKVYLPIPHRMVTLTSAPVETSMFSCEQPVKRCHTRVGSSFRISDGDRSTGWLGTAAKLYYVLSWAVDDKGFPKAPPAEPVPPSIGGTVAARLTRRQFEWLMKLRFDPNHPGNTSLQELIREMREMEKNSDGHFRLEPIEEPCFATDEQLDAIRRFRLLSLRESLHAPEALRTFPVPLLDRQITQAMMEDYTGGQCELPAREKDDLAADRKWVIQYFQKLVSDVEKNMHHIQKKYKLSDIVWEHQNADRPLEISWDMFRRARQLKPRCQTVERVHPGLLSNGGLVIRVNVQSAVHLPIRQERHNDMENRGACCGLSSGTHSLIHWTNRGSPKLQPFAEVNFQRSSFQTRVAEGPDPIWREKFAFVFCSLDADYSHAGLAKNRDDIIINIFDAVSFQLTERDTLKGCGAHTFFGKQWLGSVTIPFRALLQQPKMECTLRISVPPALLGYTWPRDLVKQDEASFLSVLIALDPHISSKDDPSVLVTMLLLFFNLSRGFCPADESEETLKLAHEFEKKCRAAGRQKRLVSVVVNSEGQLVLPTRFFRPLPPPPGILHHDGDERIEEEQLTLLHQRRVAAFVSLIPVLPSSSEVGDHGEMWLTSGQCLDLVIGNSISLAVLLCNFFLHMQGMTAWVVLGTSAIEDGTAYVFSSHRNSGELLWNPKDGQHYSIDTLLLNFPIRKVDYLVNWQNVHNIFHISSNAQNIS